VSSLFQRFYDDKAADYQAIDRRGRLRYRRAIEVGQVTAGQAVLDIACKRGSLLQLLQEDQVNVAYTGLDLAPESIAHNQAQWPAADHPDVSWLVADATTPVDLPDASFDRVIALEVMEHVSEPLALLANAHRLLKPGGALILSVPNPYYYAEILSEIRLRPDSEGHIYAWADNNLVRLLGFAGFTVAERRGTYLEVPTALRHPYQRGRVAILERVPRLLARSRVYRCVKA